MTGRIGPKLPVLKMSTTPQAAARSSGLDTLRAAAILLVFMYHYQVFVSGEATFGWGSTLGWVGVDLFFVLSGYLIGNQIFSGLVRGAPFSPTAFYARRLLRTLPNYWVVLALYFLLPTVMGGKTPPPLWRFLTFTQNIGLHSGTAFSHAWSLCIEEQFYLLLPLTVVLGLRFTKSVSHAWIFMAALALGAVFIRSVFWLDYGREAGDISGYYPNVYYATLCRFDEFLPGVAVALIKNAHPKHWTWLMQRGQGVLLAGALATLTMLALMFNYYYIDDYGYGFAMTAVGYSAMATCFAVLIIAALSPSSSLYRLRIPGAASLAVWSYAIYLSHKPIAMILKMTLTDQGLSDGLLLAIITGACLLGGWLLYRGVELPFMRLRDRYFPSNFPVQSLRAEAITQ